MVIGFIRVPVGSLRLALVSSGLFGFSLVHSGAARGLRLYWGTLESRTVAPEFAWVDSCAHIGRRVHSSYLSFTPVRLRVLGLIRVRVGSLRRT